jgi:hypothetical protein
MIAFFFVTSSPRNPASRNQSSRPLPFGSLKLAKAPRKSDRINPPEAGKPATGTAGKQDQQDVWSLYFITQ